MNLILMNSIIISNNILRIPAKLFLIYSSHLLADKSTNESSIESVVSSDLCEEENTFFHK